LERSLDYPENSAGRRMQTDFIAVRRVGPLDKPSTICARRWICRIGSTKSMPSETTGAGRARCRSMRCCVPVQLADLIDKDRRRVSVMDAQEEVARLFGKYNLVTAPVLDPDNRLVGVITVDGVVDVIAEEADEEIKALGGITSDEERSDSIWTIARGRFNWLLVNLATAFLVASVLGLFKGQFEKMVALAVLAPIVATRAATRQPRP
jgi:magnesium transporter